MDTTTYKATVIQAFNRGAASYDRGGVEFFTPMGRRLVERVGPQPGEAVLDIGCGRGACSFPAAERVGPSGRVLGIDLAEAMVEQARRQAHREQVDNLAVRVMDGEHPDLPARSFDVVLGSYSLIFLPDAPGALARYATLLRDHGRIGFTSPVFSEDTFPFLPPVFTELIPRSLLRNLPPQWQPEQLRRRFNSWLADPAALQRTMAGAGFTSVEILDEPVNMVTTSGTAWVDWSHSQGMRLLWDHLPEQDSAQLRARLIGALDAMRGGADLLTIKVPVRYVTAIVAR